MPCVLINDGICAHFFMSKYLLTGKYSKITLFGRLLAMGISLLLLLSGTDWECNQNIIMMIYTC